MSKQNEKTVKKATLPRPAFSAASGALAFLGLMIFVMLLPKIISDYSLVSRADSYDIMPENYGEYSFIKNEIFSEKEPIDILFLGTSVLWNAVDTPLVERELSRKLGRSTRVRTFGFYFSGVDPAYAMLRDLLDRRRVKMVVLSIPREKLRDNPSLPGCRFIRYDDFPEIYARLPLRAKLSLYSCSILRAPHDLLTAVRHGRSEPSPFAERLGANKELLGMGRRPWKFEKFAPPPPDLSNEKLIYSNENRTNFQFLGDEPGEFQRHYLEALFELLEEENVPFLLLNIPQYAERQNRRVTEKTSWSQRFEKKIPLAGVPPATLFAGLDEKEIEKLYCDEDHFNANGNEFFTRALLPEIIRFYENNAIEDF